MHGTPSQIAGVELPDKAVLLDFAWERERREFGVGGEDGPSPVLCLLKTEY